MNKAFVLWTMAAVFALPVAARAKTILPDSCGSDDVKFDVETKKDQPAPTAPEAGKAQFIFVQNTGTYEHMVPPIRYGVDGAWVGANKANSYFAVSVDPGEHHICTSLQMGMGRGSLVKSSAQLATFTAEAGKTYYFEAAISIIRGGNNGGGAVSFDLTQLSDDVGKYRVKAWKLANSKPNK